MKEKTKLKFWINFYLAVFAVLLLCIITTPLLIKHGLTFSRNLIVEEGIIETVLISFLFGLSYFIFKGLKHSISVYETAAKQARTEKQSLISRLSDAFKYIGSVNLEVESIQSILCGMDHYPRNKTEFRRIFDHLTTAAATIAQTQWAVIRIIDKDSGRTAKELSCQAHQGELPSSTVGNRAILTKNYTKDFDVIQTHPKNNDLCSVCILPKDKALTIEQTALLTAVVSQAELYYRLYRSSGRNLNQGFDLAYSPQGNRKERPISSQSL